MDTVTRLTLTFHTDPGHGWLAVPFALLIAVLGSAKEISRFSYRKGDTAYLEEDCDAGKFIDAAKEQGYEIDIIEHNEPHNQSPIRTYAPIHRGGWA